MNEIIDASDESKQLLLASQGKRFLNFVLDFICVNVLMIILMIIFDLFQKGDFVITALLIVLFQLYYVLMEFCFGKTIGKLLTKTHVVNG